MIVSFAPDLLMRSKIDVAARHYGAAVCHVADAAALRRELARGAVALVLLDLDHEGEEMVALVAEARQAGAGRVVAFCSHVRTDLIQAARAAGAHTVMANSTFAASVPGLVAEACQSPTPTATDS
ncbi:MAG: hypothetical protein KF858_05205 [Candidatus Sumerlaeia bacterium]|nr:hypothetical protein [Candidatus Sumerlaeia bacterium]